MVRIKISSASDSKSLNQVPKHSKAQMSCLIQLFLKALQRMMQIIKCFSVRCKSKSDRIKSRQIGAYNKFQPLTLRLTQSCANHGWLCLARGLDVGRLEAFGKQLARPGKAWQSKARPGKAWDG